MSKQEEKSIVTSAWIQDELRSIAEETRKSEHGSAGLNVARLMNIAQLRGDIIDRREIKQVDEFEDMGFAELKALIEAEHEALFGSKSN